jgi:hypothetical protein
MTAAHTPSLEERIDYARQQLILVSFAALALADDEGDTEVGTVLHAIRSGVRHVLDALDPLLKVPAEVANWQPADDVTGGAR